MKEMNIKDIHDVTLNIMKDIHEFCMTNNVQYSLAYGSMIGAIRHKGFIPWDDDIDIWMTRPNFEKFTRTYVSKNGYRHSSIYDKDSLICFDRVYEIKKTLIKTQYKACDGDVGVFVDVFPLDGVPDDERSRNKQYSTFSNGIKRLLQVRWLIGYIERKQGWRRLYGIFRLLCNDIRCGGYRNVHKKMIGIAKAEDVEKSNYCCYFQCGDAYRKNQQELLPTASFKNFILTEFEDARFMMSEDYDRILKIIYGDYMKLPPEKERCRSHGVCYWK